jgi:hypothetical protein
MIAENRSCENLRVRIFLPYLRANISMRQSGRPIMGVKRNTILGILTIAAFIGCGLMANAQEKDSYIDYPAFWSFRMRSRPIASNASSLSSTSTR